MTSPPKRVPIACTNCRFKKLRCRTDEGHKACTRCISDGCPCEYVPVNAHSTTPTAPHPDPLLTLQPSHQVHQGFHPAGNTPSGYYSTQPSNVQQPAPNPNPINYIDSTLMGPQGNVNHNPPAAANYSSGHPLFYSAAVPHGPLVHAANNAYPSPYLQNHGHPGSTLPGPQWGDQSSQFGTAQASSMGQAPHATYNQGVSPTGVAWVSPNYYPHSSTARPTTSDQQDHPYSQMKGDF